jgi:hypothetical protein
MEDVRRRASTPAKSPVACAVDLGSALRMRMMENRNVDTTTASGNGHTRHETFARGGCLAANTLRGIDVARRTSVAALC